MKKTQLIKINRKKKIIFRKTVKKKEKKYISISTFKKLLIIIFLSNLTTILFFLPKKTINKTNEETKKETIKETIQDIDLNNPLEHYRILFPKKKFHNLKKYSLEERNILFKLEDSVDYERMKNKKNNESHIYFSCLVTQSTNYNLYVKESIEHYLKIGVDKYYIGDDNHEDVENFGDILGDYVKKGVVDIEYIYTRNMSQKEFYEYSFRALKDRCKWLLYFDMDEFLEFVDNNMTIKSYLTMPTFDKCDAIRIHWKTYDDNNLVYYDNRTMKERFPRGLLNNKHNAYHKSIIRGKNYNLSWIWTNPHQPEDSKIPSCNAVGNFERGMGQKNHELCYLRHHITKTAEEYAIKVLVGGYQGHKFNKDFYVDAFFNVNNLTKEKLFVLEHILNRTFPNFREKLKQN